ncbi:MAG: TIGR02206 family membrane protein [Bacteroidia bacterium]|nr:TIGR02206 family membrane protein [Bacteroidia bacterium]
MEGSAFIAYNQDFVLFGQQHLAALVTMILLAVFLPLAAKKILNRPQQLLLSRGMAVVISLSALMYVFIRMWLGDFEYKTDLPLDICNMVAVLLPVLMWKPSFRVHEILYFWILAGTIQAIITPHLFNGFPNYIFIKYWFVHAGLVVFAIYVTFVFDLKPNIRSLWKSFIALQVYIVFILGVNLILGSNYVYVLGKPPTSSVLDYFGPWPYYILVGEFIALALFFIVYLPIWKLSGSKNLKTKGVKQ